MKTAFRLSQSPVWILQLMVNIWNWNVMMMQYSLIPLVAWHFPFQMIETDDIYYHGLVSGAGVSKVTIQTKQINSNCAVFFSLRGNARMKRGSMEVWSCPVSDTLSWTQILRHGLHHSFLCVSLSVTLPLPSSHSLLPLCQALSVCGFRRATRPLLT